MINPEARPIELPSTTPIATIQRVVAGSFGVPMEHMLSDRRDNAWPRQVAMYLSRELTSKSLPVIARCFRRDHTTVLYACRKVKRSVEKHPLIRADIDALKDALRPVDKVDNCPFSATFEPLNAIEQTMKTQAESMVA